MFRERLALAMAAPRHQRRQARAPIWAQQPAARMRTSLLLAASLRNCLRRKAGAAYPVIRLAIFFMRAVGIVWRALLMWEQAMPLFLAAPARLQHGAKSVSAHMCLGRLEQLTAGPGRLVMRRAICFMPYPAALWCACRPV